MASQTVLGRIFLKSASLSCTVARSRFSFKGDTQTYNQCCGSGSKLDPYSTTLWIRIHTGKKRIINKLDAIEDKNHQSETRLTKKRFRCHYFLLVGLKIATGNQVLSVWYRYIVTRKQMLSVCGCLDEAGALNIGHKVGQMLRQRLHTQQKVAISLISLLIPVQYCTGKPWRPSGFPARQRTESSLIKPNVIPCPCLPGSLDLLRKKNMETAECACVLLVKVIHTYLTFEHKKKILLPLKLCSVQYLFLWI